MRLAHFYHVFADGPGWTTAADEHIAALRMSRFPPPIHLGLVGSMNARNLAWRAFFEAGYAPRVQVEANKGFEQVTLAAVREWAIKHEGAVMYAHSKGASEPDEKRDNWRKAMTKLIVSDWRVNVTELEKVQAVGMHWLTPDTCPGTTAHPFFAGNFWIARCDYLRTLPPPDPTSDDRMKAETWVGIGNPEVLDLMPGWPAERRWAEMADVV